MLLRIMTSSMLAAFVTLSPSAEQTKPAAPMHDDFQITGTLVDASSGQPLSHARVAIAPIGQRDDFITVVTAEDGSFSFANLVPGKYTLTAQARAHLLQSFNQHDQFSSSIVVGPGLDSVNLLFRLPTESGISGVVSDEAGEPVCDAQVSLYFTGLSAGVGGTRLRGRTMTNDEGSYRFGHLAPGRYLVAVYARPWYAQHPMSGKSSASAPSASDTPSMSSSANIGGVTLRGAPGNRKDGSPLDVAYPVTFYGGVTEAEAATLVALDHGDNVTANISLQPVQALTLHLVADHGDLAPGSSVVLEQRVLDGPPIPMSVETRSINQTVREIVGVAPGRYTVRSFLASNSGSSETAPPVEIVADSSGEINMSESTVHTPVAVTLHFVGGAQARQTYLQLLNKKTRQWFSEPVSADGEIVFKQGLPPGSYEISLTNGRGFYLKDISATGTKILGRTIEIRPGTPVKLSISAARGEGEITGKALHDGRPSAGAMIVLVPADPAHNQVLFRRDQTNSDGSFAISNVVPGSYTLLAIEDGWKLEWVNPEVLRHYLAQGADVLLQPNGKHDVTLTVQ